MSGRTKIFILRASILSNHTKILKTKISAYAAFNNDEGVDHLEGDEEASLYLYPAR